MDTLRAKYDIEVKNAYIISLPNNETSVNMTNKCIESCDNAGMKYVVWEGYDGVNDQNLIVPPKLMEKDSFMKMIKVRNHYLTRGEIACALSHISLWSECVLIDEPIVILEHDALMLNKYTIHHIFNSICYLGCTEQTNSSWGVFPTPPHASDGPNFHFICRAHAYAIDPAVAKNMCAHVLKYGIHDSLDKMLRADLFPIYQSGLYATDISDKSNTTILGRKNPERIEAI